MLILRKLCFWFSPRKKMLNAFWDIFILYITELQFMSNSLPFSKTTKIINRIVHFFLDSVKKFLNLKTSIISKYFFFLFNIFFLNIFLETKKRRDDEKFFRASRVVIFSKKKEYKIISSWLWKKKKCLTNVNRN